MANYLPQAYIDALTQLRTEGYQGDLYTEIVKRVHGITDPTFKLEGAARNMVKGVLYQHIYSLQPSTFPSEENKVLRERKASAVEVDFSELEERILTEMATEQEAPTRSSWFGKRTKNI